MSATVNGVHALLRFLLTLPFVCCERLPNDTVYETPQDRGVQLFFHSSCCTVEPKCGTEALSLACNRFMEVTVLWVSFYSFIQGFCRLPPLWTSYAGHSRKLINYCLNTMWCSCCMIVLVNITDMKER